MDKVPDDEMAEATGEQPAAAAFNLDAANPNGPPSLAASQEFC